MIKILLADDHSIVRNGIKNLLEKELDISIVGEATNGNDAMQLVNRVKPDIILADMNMPGLGGIELAEQILAVNSKIKVILLTMHDHQHYVTKALKAGIYAYLFKNISAEELIFAIRQVYQGKQYLCMTLSLRLIDHAISSPRMDEDAPQVDFTDREREILKLIADGYTNQEIADRIFTSKRTVEGYRRAMIDNAGVQNTAALIRYAMRRKIID
jgi:DNA-binding NarL/FixJ family response regulator